MESNCVINPNNGGRGLMEEEENPNSDTKRPKIVVIMGPTGSGKSRLAIDLASHFPIEIINADSMQVYQGLDVLTNKVPIQEQQGVPHHLLGTISPNVEFTSKDFRNYAIPLINDILSRNCLPVIVGGTNYYIQALVSPFLLDESVEDIDECCSNVPPGDKQDLELEFSKEVPNYSYDCLKDIDPVAANRIHPNDHRKINQYLCLYARSGILPSELLQQTVMENWGRVDNFRYDCCFICVDASLSVLDQYVEQRVDSMIAAGLLDEVYDIYNFNADYTRGLRQAIGVHEFEDLLRIYLSENDSTDGSHFQTPNNKGGEMFKEHMRVILDSSDENRLKLLLVEAVDKMKANTRRLVRRQRRRVNRLRTLFGWNIHCVDSTDPLLGKSDDSWTVNVVEPAVSIIKSYLYEETSLVSESEPRNGCEESKLAQRDLWTQHVCKACGNRVLRGAHEWEQHIRGRSHRKRICSLRKSGTTLP